MSKTTIVIEKKDLLKMTDLIQTVNIHRKERLHTAMKQGWDLAKELEFVDYEEVSE